MSLAVEVHETTTRALSGLRDLAVGRLRETSLAQRFVTQWWPVVRFESDVILRAAGAITLILWFKRIVEQLLGAKWLNESIMNGHWNDFVKEFQVDAEIRSRS